MRFVFLYLRTRRTSRTVFTLSLIAPVTWALTWLLVETSPYGVGSGGLTLLLVFGTLAAACVVGTGVRSPFGDAERVAARPLTPVRFGHVAGMLLWAALLLSTALLSFDLEGASPEYPLLVLLRNLAGFSGLAFLTASIAGAQLSWIPPFAVSIVYLTLMSTGGDLFSRWAMRSHDGNHGPSWLIALTLLGVGVGVVSLLGSRETPGELE